MRIPITLLALLFLATATVHADIPTSSSKQSLCLQDDRCRQHSMSAKDLSKAGQLPAAIGEYEAAYQEVQLPVFLYNIARLHHRLGNLEQATAFYRRFIDAAVDDDPEQRARAVQYLAQLQQSAVTPAPVLQATEAPKQPAKQPLYKKWWIWTITGIVVAGAVAGIAGYVATRPATVDATGLPTYEPAF